MSHYITFASFVSEKVNIHKHFYFTLYLLYMYVLKEWFKIWNHGVPLISLMFVVVCQPAQFVPLWLGAGPPGLHVWFISKQISQWTLLHWEKKKTITRLPLPPSYPVQTIVQRLTFTSITYIFGWAVSASNTQERTLCPVPLLPTGLSLVCEVEALGVGWQRSWPVSQSGGAVDGNHVSSDFNWLGLNEVICWDRVTHLGCPFGNSCMRDVYHPAHGWVVWCWRHARSSWRGYEGFGAPVLGPPGTVRVD